VVLNRMSTGSAEFIPIFETKSNRVKGVAFHPTRPWILASLHNGVIQLWDYRIRTLVDRFGDHSGPVRAVDFHHSQPIFVSGGDDYKIKVWNYRERRCIFTLVGHVDYIRTVQFHHEYPWILSASDDQTIRIWNWQSRQCLAVFPGHSHYVMCARFHPTEDLVVSASLDQTVRVWDISGLRKKNIAPMPSGPDTVKFQNDLFGTTDAIVKYVLEGHERGVNWAAFHPTSPYIVSGADDKYIKLWRMNDNKAWEMDTLRGHFNNVCCVIFHPREELLLSLGEDRMIRVWDLNKRTTIFAHRRDNERFWMLNFHPKLNIFVAGHDTGLVVFKLAHERPPYHASGDVLMYVKDRFIRSYTFENSRDIPLLSLKRNNNRIKSIAHNPKENEILVTYTGTENGRYELYSVPQDGKSTESTPRSGHGRAAVWIRRNRFAVLEKGDLITIKDTTNATTKKITPPFSVDNIFAGATDTILFKSDDRLTLYDVVQERLTPAEIKLTNVKQVIWSNQEKGSGPAMVAIVGITSVILADHKLELLVAIPEIMKVKSGVWDENGTFIYSTLSHIKYALPNGDHGTIRTIDRPIYITSIKNNQVFCIDRRSKTYTITIDTTEYLFKRALSRHRFDEVLRMVKNSNLIGEAIIGYLQRQGYPEVALQFVKDEKTRFNLALECSNMRNIDIALQSAKVLDDKESWTKLGTEALRQGNHQVVEKAYQQTLDFERLSFLYFITGNNNRLNRMLSIADEKRKDPNARFYNALLLGDVAERVRVLEEHGQHQLAYMTAINHGLLDAANNIKTRVQAQQKDGDDGENKESPLAFPEPIAGAKLFIPPIPILRLDKSNWPMTRLARGPFDDSVIESTGATTGSRLKVDDVQDDQEGGDWVEEIQLSDSEEGGRNEHPTTDDGDVQDEEENGWPPDEELEGLEDDLPPTPGKNKSRNDKYVTLPPVGQSKAEVWSRTSNLAADSAAAGKFEDAIQLLHQQIGAINFQPLKPMFLRLHQGSSVQLIALSGLPPITVHLERKSPPSREGEANPVSTGLPRLSITLKAQIDKLTEAYRAFSNGQFVAAKDLFTTILQALPLIVAQSPEEAKEIKDLVGICREYLIGIAAELKRKDIASGGESKRSLELAAYFANCDLQKKHVQLSLKSAMNIAAKIKNFGIADEFGRRLLDLNPPEATVTHTRKVLRLCEQKGRANEISIDYDSRNPFVICSGSLTPIYQGSPSTRCSYCEANYKPEFNAKLCVLCNISQIGSNAQGLQSLPANKRRGK